MSFLKKMVLPIVTATLWISLSEFVRNELLFKHLWIDHYQRLGLTFPSEPVNGAVWGIWSLLLAIAIYIIAEKFTLLQTTFLSWFMAFVMMWVVAGNLDVLPLGLLYAAVPMSLLETFIAALLIQKMSGKSSPIEMT